MVETPGGPNHFFLADDVQLLRYCCSRGVYAERFLRLFHHGKKLYNSTHHPKPDPSVGKLRRNSMENLTRTYLQQYEVSKTTDTTVGGQR